MFDLEHFNGCVRSGDFEEVWSLSICPYLTRIPCHVRPVFHSLFSVTKQAVEYLSSYVMPSTNLVALNIVFELRQANNINRISTRPLEIGRVVENCVGNMKDYTMVINITA